jgi:hypothetical protein
VAVDLRSGIIDMHREDLEEHRQIFPMQAMVTDIVMMGSNQSRMRASVAHQPTRAGNFSGTYQTQQKPLVQMLDKYQLNNATKLALSTPRSLILCGVRVPHVATKFQALRCEINPALSFCSLGRGIELCRIFN